MNALYVLSSVQDGCAGHAKMQPYTNTKPFVVPTAKNAEVSDTAEPNPIAACAADGIRKVGT